VGKARGAGKSSVDMTVRALELFCGIGGFAAAVTGTEVEIVGALDQDPTALGVYRLNFPSRDVRQQDLEKISAAELAAFGADLWWLSPPCQPYCVRGARRDLDDPRARSLARLLDVLAVLTETELPRYLALENVTGFAGSQAHKRLLTILHARGFQVRERCLCPTELGVPSRRPRYYLAASRGPLPPPPAPAAASRRLASYLEPASASCPLDRLLIPAHILERFGNGLRILDPDDPGAYTTCFTASYGKSVMHSGSYLLYGNGVRYFAPEEVARLLHFPDNFHFPEGMSNRRKWHLLGNSLSIVAVHEVLSVFQGNTA